jgi:hypothetical protein
MHAIDILRASVPLNPMRKHRENGVARLTVDFNQIVAPNRNYRCPGYILIENATQVRQADRVLLIFTDTYRRRFEGDEEEGAGLGATFEGMIVTQALYDACGRSAKFQGIKVESSQKYTGESDVGRQARETNRPKYKAIFLGTFGGYQTIATGINDVDQIVGYSQLPGGNI